jgi:UDP-N-acetylmuramoyl-L-alanyl-D-glutamate--2,6-diaminopimelate ligase
MLLDDLRDVAVRSDPAARVVGPGSVTAPGVTHDSRLVAPGVLFACVRGASFDGHVFAADAVRAGAGAVLVDHELDPAMLTPPGSSEPVPQLVVADVRRALGPIASAVHHEPSTRMTVVGVTGTNGKTTTTHLLAGILGADGRQCAVIGTLGGVRTTPEAPELQQLLADHAASGIDAVAMEVSSHALDQHRVDGTRFSVAAFTNLSVDHLDYHGDMESYYRAKARLFTPELCDHAVVNVDSEAGRRLATEATVPVTTCSLDDATGIHIGTDGTDFHWRGHLVRLHLVGRFNVANAVTAATTAEVLGVAPDVIARGLGSTASVEGRFEQVAAGQPFTVVVDFAHTPDGLGHALTAASEMAGDGRTIVVFGCGGERDTTKRALMGQVAAESGAAVVLTADNSRSERTGDIIDAIVAGMDDSGAGAADVVIEPDRRRAIAAACAMAQPGDVVLIAGRGHESTLTIGGRSEPFRDASVAADVLGDMGWISIGGMS